MRSRDEVLRNKILDEWFVSVSKWEDSDLADGACRWNVQFLPS